MAEIKSVYADIKRSDKHALMNFMGSIEAIFGPLTDFQKKFILDQVKVVDGKVEWQKSYVHTKRKL